MISEDYKSVDYLKSLFKDGSDPNKTKNCGITALMSSWNAKQTKFLIEIGADLDTQDDFGETALMKSNDIEITRLLLEAGADVSIQDNCEYKVIHYVKNLEQLKLLIEYGADPEAKNDDGKTLLDRTRNNDDLITHDVDFDYNHSQCIQDFLINDLGLV